jgi:DNA-binding NarL/FixJ family response regulator
MMIPDVIRQLLAEQEDMEIVADVRGPMKVLQETGRVNADAVILAQEGTEEPGLCSQLLAVYPDLTIVSVTTDMTTAITQQLRSHRQSLPAREDLDVLRAMRMAIRHQYGEKWI